MFFEEMHRLADSLSGRVEEPVQGVMLDGAGLDRLEGVVRFLTLLKAEQASGEPVPRALRQLLELRGRPLVILAETRGQRASEFPIGDQPIPRRRLARAVSLHGRNLPRVRDRIIDRA